MFSDKCPCKGIYLLEAEAGSGKDRFFPGIPKIKRLIWDISFRGKGGIGKMRNGNCYAAGRGERE